LHPALLPRSELTRSTERLGIIMLRLWSRREGRFGPG